MRLYELIDFRPQKVDKTYIDYNNRVDSMLPNQSTLGLGHFARVSQLDSPKRLNQVRKVGVAGKAGKNGPVLVQDQDQDGYLSYLEMVYNDKSNNPYFPRIHDLKIIQDADAHISYSANIEKLYPIDSKKIIDNEQMMDAIKHKMFIMPSDGLNAVRYDVLDIVTLCEIIFERETNSIKDPQLKDAIEKINELKEWKKLSWDLHQGNMMWRITGKMPQLVITDPLA